MVGKGRHQCVREAAVDGSNVSYTPGYGPRPEGAGVDTENLESQEGMSNQEHSPGTRRHCNVKDQ